MVASQEAGHDDQELSKVVPKTAMCRLPKQPAPNAHGRDGDEVSDALLEGMTQVPAW